jgi:IS5 family transposase
VQGTAAIADVNPMPEPLHGQEKVVYGDRAYWRQQDRALLEGSGVHYRVNRCGTGKILLPEHWRLINRARSRIRARGEHTFRVVKQLWGFAKVRYRGLAKNLARAYTMFALADLYLMRRQLA